MLNKIDKLLSKNTYPGRGIIIGKSKDNKNAVIAYFIMGRSENSRNRIFTVDGDGIKTEAFDASKLSDPSLIIYSPVKVYKNNTIVTNGDQTDTIYDFLATDKTFKKALKTRTFEPDAPNFTPRISAILKTDKNKYEYKLAILKSACGNENSCQRFFYEYAEPIAGEGHFIHTYKKDGNPIPSFEGEPTLVEIPDDMNEFTNLIWKSLNEDNKVSLFVRYINLETGKVKSKIINKLKQEKTLWNQN